MAEKPNKNKTSIYKPKPVSCFPEWLPEERLVEQRWLDHIRRTFESYGFCSIETPSVEEIDVLLAKGEVDKEIYVLERLHKDEEDDKEARLALHFDQTVPFARYTAQHFNDLTFPFKRYQMQRVWRGERPQMGRMREFTQCDIDVINVDNLPLHFDAEVAAMAYEALKGLNIGRVQLRISNRKILIGLLEGKTKDVSKALSTIDKIEKIGTDEVSKLLSKECDLSDEHIKTVMNLVGYDGFYILGGLEMANETMKQGFEELKTLRKDLSQYLTPDVDFITDLSIVRGLDYYTGTVYETILDDHPEIGSVCSGGRYDNLASFYTESKLPGVGISIGATRLFYQLREAGLFKDVDTGLTNVLVAHLDPALDDEYRRLASKLRRAGVTTALEFSGSRLKKQLKYAARARIPLVAMIGENESKQGIVKLKDLRTGEQRDVPADDIVSAIQSALATGRES